MRKLIKRIKNNTALMIGLLTLSAGITSGLTYTDVHAETVESNDKSDQSDKSEESDKSDQADGGKDSQSLMDKAYLTEDDLKQLEWSFAKSDYAVITYDSIRAEINTNIPSKFARVTYSTDSLYASVTEGIEENTVQIRGSYAGITNVTATIVITYRDNDGLYEEYKTKTLTATTKVRVLETSVHSLTVGEQVKLDYTEYEEYSGMTYVLEKAEYASVGDKGLITATSPGYTAVYLTDGKNKNIYAGSLSIKSNDIYISDTNVTRAIGSQPYKLELLNMNDGTVTWSSSNSAIAAVDAYGNVTPVAEGETIVTASHTATSGLVMTYTCTFTVTSPKLSISSGNVAKGHSLVVSVMGTTGVASWASSDKKIVSVYSAAYSEYSNTTDSKNPSATIYGNKKGSAVITVQVDGISLNCNITVTDPVLKKSFYLVTKGTRYKLGLKGTNSKSDVKYSSTNKNVATVSSSGVVSIKGEGYATIKIEVDGAIIAASVNVGNKKAVKAVNNALKVEGATYSQARRMSKGYYDCSSLVWRSYSPLGAYFGDRYYAPVAANEARYCVSHKKSVPAKYINKLNKLKPGDLIFFKGKRNGRYKNIYHVAIYMGQEGYGSYTIGKIIHADGRKVSQAYVYNQSNVVVIGRPFK